MLADVNVLLKLDPQDAFDQWLALPGEWVEPPNIRRGGESGVKRVFTSTSGVLYCKQQVEHTYKSLRHPFGYPTAMRERDVLQACVTLKVAAPVIVYAYCRKVAGVWQALLVTKELEGFSSLEDCYARGDEQVWGEALHQRVLLELGACIARLNLGRLQHGCLRMKHIFVRVQGEEVEVGLLDLEKSRQRFTVRQAGQHDIQQLKRHSSWTDSQWQAFADGYETVFGGTFKGLR